MRVDIEKITNAISKVSAITSDLKVIPGVLLDLSDDILKVCFSDGHKSLIEEIGVTMEEGDYTGGFVVTYEQLSRAIANCQPSGIIKVNEVKFTFKEGNIITISTDQSLELRDNDGNITGDRKMASKQMDLSWVKPDSDMKTSLLSRMKYADIFNPVTTEGAEIKIDTFDRQELINALSKTSVEKGKQIYISAKTQSVFVMNQAHLTSIPISGYEVAPEMKSGIASALNANGMYTEESFKQACNNAENRIHFSISMSQVIAKAVVEILNKTSADTISVYTRDKFCNMYIDNEDEKVGIWFEMIPASKAHLGSLEKYSKLEYKCYQLLFIREFLNDMIKSALNATKSEKVELKFAPTTNENPSSSLDMIIEGGSASNSTSDIYSINPDSIVDVAGDLQSKTFNISLKVISDMLAQLKTTRVALDINIAPTDGSVCLRLTEIDDIEFAKAFSEARQATKTMCENDGQPFEENSTPTRLECKLEYLRRNSVMLTRQYTMLSA